MSDRFIVAEISKNWINGTELHPERGLIAQQFERAINVNAARGYRLLTFSLHRLTTKPDELNETIIAVFERIMPSATAHTPTPPREWLTVKDVTKYMKCSLTTAYQLVKDKKIKAAVLGSEFRILKEWVDEWLLEQAQTRTTGQQP